MPNCPSIITGALVKRSIPKASSIDQAPLIGLGLAAPILHDHFEIAGRATVALDERRHAHGIRRSACGPPGFVVMG
jgi:hypothetical protein